MPGHGMHSPIHLSDQHTKGCWVFTQEKANLVMTTWHSATQTYDEM